MTTTSTFTGLGEDAKPTSRVLKPPGGGTSNIFGGPEPAAAAPAKPRGTPARKPDSGIFGGASADSSDGKRSARDGSYNILTGADYKDLAPNHHALHIKETPKAQKEQPPLPCSDSEYQAKEGKMQNVQTSTRVTNPPGGKTHKLW